MRRDDDPKKFTEACLNTPFAPDKDRLAEAHKAKDPALLLSAPGTCLKSRERESPHGFPRHHGILVDYDLENDYVLVRGHNSPVSPPCVWEGTIPQYLSMWEVDS